MKIFVPDNEGYGEHEDRGSKFYAWVFYAPDLVAFQNRLSQIKGEHAKARHWCWAWRIGDAYRFEDDGEPGGTAGRPMLQVLEGSDMSDVAAVCVRYFGGVKLGTGGLMRAYSGATARALDNTPRREVIPKLKYHLAIPFELLGLRTELEAVCGSILFAGDFGDDGWLGSVILNENEGVIFENLLSEKGNGKVKWSLQEC
ncbi:MAG: YigZ family protein [Planctomycetota bacterium]|nr:YigZ family protein [Planctomycetota bacterium]